MRCLARPAAESRHGGDGGLSVLLLFLIDLCILSDSPQTNYLKICWTDL